MSLHVLICPHMPLNDMSTKSPSTLTLNDMTYMSLYVLERPYKHIRPSTLPLNDMTYMSLHVLERPYKHIRPSTLTGHTGRGTQTPRPPPSLTHTYRERESEQEGNLVHARAKSRLVISLVA